MDVTDSLRAVTSGFCYSFTRCLCYPARVIIAVVVVLVGVEGGVPGVVGVTGLTSRLLLWFDDVNVFVATQMIPFV